jgi:glutamate synthase domain-containing protein 1
MVANSAAALAIAAAATAVQRRRLRCSHTCGAAFRQSHLLLLAPYFCCVSVLQGMLRSVVVGAFFKDLVNTDYETAFAIYHRRFSTNTTPKWPLAQPMRILGHNGEASWCNSRREPTRA